MECFPRDHTAHYAVTPCCAVTPCYATLSPHAKLSPQPYGTKGSAHGKPVGSPNAPTLHMGKPRFLFGPGKEHVPESLMQIRRHPTWLPKPRNPQFCETRDPPAAPNPRPARQRGPGARFPRPGAHLRSAAPARGRSGSRGRTTFPPPPARSGAVAPAAAPPRRWCGRGGAAAVPGGGGRHTRGPGRRRARLAARTWPAPPGPAAASPARRPGPPPCGAGAPAAGCLSLPSGRGGRRLTPHAHDTRGRRERGGGGGRGAPHRVLLRPGGRRSARLSAAAGRVRAGERGVAAAASPQRRSAAAALPESAHHRTSRGGTATAGGSETLPVCRSRSRGKRSVSPAVSPAVFEEFTNNEYYERKMWRVSRRYVLRP